MNTRIFNKTELSEAAAMIRDGAIIVMPTETVYGLAANALDEEAVKKIFEAKGRQSDNPLIVHIANIADWEELVQEIPPQAKLLAERFWPGPLTIVLKKKAVVPDIVSGGLDTVAVRMPKNKIAFRFIKECGVPIAAPSANLSGAPSPTKFSHVVQDMDGRVDGIIDGGDCMVGLESTVISLAEEVPTILRPGRITAEQIQKLIGEVKIHPAVQQALKEGEQAASPGMKYKHYAPKASLTLIKGSDQQFEDYVNEHADETTAVICYNEEENALFTWKPFLLGAKDDSVSQAKRLFDVLRAVDEAEFAKALAPLPESKGVGLAVANRLLRAAGFHVVDLTEPAQPTLAKELVHKKSADTQKPDTKHLNTELAEEPADDSSSVEVIGLETPPESESVAPEKPGEPEKEQSSAANEKKAKKEKKHKKKNAPANPIALAIEQGGLEELEKLEQIDTPKNEAPDEPDIEPENEDDILANEFFNWEEEDSSILALSDVQLSQDFNEDFSKEISDNITVIERTSEEDPTKIFYEAVIDGSGAKPAAYPVDSIGDDFQFDVYDDDIEAQRNQGLFSFLKRKKRVEKQHEEEPEPFIPKRNSLWDANRPMNTDLRVHRSLANASAPAAKKEEEGDIISNAPKYEKIEGIRVIGITGKSGSGKSFLTKVMASKTPDSLVIEADTVYHAMLKRDSMKLDLVLAFGKEVLEGKSIDRKKLAAVVFQNKENLRMLNETVLPKVAEEILKLMVRAKQKGIKTIFLDAPTLIESGMYQICNEVIFVTADPTVRQERLVQRDNLTLDEVTLRMSLEKPDEFYVRFADRIIRNN